MSTDTTESLKTSVGNGKSAIASAITDKGVSTASDATFQTMATNIRSIVSDERIDHTASYSDTDVTLDRELQIMESVELHLDISYKSTNNAVIGRCNGILWCAKNNDGKYITNTPNDYPGSINGGIYFKDQIIFYGCDNGNYIGGLNLYRSWFYDHSKFYLSWYNFFQVTAVNSCKCYIFDERNRIYV